MNMGRIWLSFLLCLCLGCGQNSATKKSHSSITAEASNDDGSAQSSAPNHSLADQTSAASDNNFVFHPFYIFNEKGSRENHYVPSGFMPDGKCVNFEDSWTQACQSGQTCLKITFEVECAKENQSWAGIYWLNPSNNWGKRKGGFNLTGAKKLSFWAKGENGGEQIQEFTVGGITGDYPDSDTISIGPVILTNQWKEYSIDLRGKDLSYISGGFAWTTSVDVNPEQCIFYLDNIKFE